MKKIALITRTKINELSECLVFTRKCLSEFKIKQGYICVTGLITASPTISSSDGEIQYLYTRSEGPSAVLNEVINKIGNKFDYFIISKEVKIKKADFQKMREIINRKNHKVLVIGYKLQDKIKETGEEITEKKDQKGIAFKVPWNTCALWNSKLFTTYVEKFDEICDGKLGEIVLSQFRPPRITKIEGMEDGLGIAKVANIPKSLGVKVILIDKYLDWVFSQEKPDRIWKQETKMARKSIVLSELMRIRNYCEGKLRNLLAVVK
ncbi:MAG: hypothetical protein V1668_00165 [Patescibacteria group bacterium]